MPATGRWAEFQEEPVWLLVNKSKMTLASPNPDVHQGHCLSGPHRAQIPSSLAPPHVPGFLLAGTLSSLPTLGSHAPYPGPAPSSTFSGHTQVSYAGQGAISSLHPAAATGLASNYTDTTFLTGSSLQVWVSDSLPCASRPRPLSWWSPVPLLLGVWGPLSICYMPCSLLMLATSGLPFPWLEGSSLFSGLAPETCLPLLTHAP